MKFIKLLALASIFTLGASQACFANEQIKRNNRLFEAYDAKEVSTFLRSGASPNARNPKNGATILMHVAAKGDTESVRLLLSKGADINATVESGEHKGFTALMAAVDGTWILGGDWYGKEHIDTLQTLIDLGASVLAETVDGKIASPTLSYTDPKQRALSSTFSKARKKEEAKINERILNTTTLQEAEALIKTGSNKFTWKERVKNYVALEQYSLIEKLENNDIETIKFFLRHDICIQCYKKYKTSSNNLRGLCADKVYNLRTFACAECELDTAARMGNKQLLDLLIKSGEQPTLSTLREALVGLKNNLFHKNKRHTHNNDHQQIIKELIAKGLCPQKALKSYKGHSQYSLSKNNHYASDFFSEMFKHPGFLNKLIITDKYLKALEFLIDYNILDVHNDFSLNNGFPSGTFPLERAIFYNQLPAGKLLLEKKADPNIYRDQSRLTLLHIVADQSYYKRDYSIRRTIGDLKEWCQLLIDHGANINAQDNSGRTPLHCASYACVVEVFLENGADVNARDNDGNTPLHYAKSKEIIKLLKQHGATL